MENHVAKIDVVCDYLWESKKFFVTNRERS